MADSIRIKFDIQKLGKAIAAKLEKISSPEALLRPIAFDLVDKMTDRIHNKGMGSDGSLIKDEGYSEPYLKYRQEKHNRTANPLVILSLTRQLEDDWSVVAIKNGYGIGFKNPFNYQKAKWMSDLFSKGGNNNRIFSLSADEYKYAQNRFKELISEQFNS